MQIGFGDARIPFREEDGEDHVSEPEIHLDYVVQEMIGAALRDYCEDIIQAPVPDKFLSLLAQLEAEERNKDRAP